MFGASNGGDTSGYGGLVRSVRAAGQLAPPLRRLRSTRSPTNSRRRWRSRAPARQRHREDGRRPRRADLPHRPRAPGPGRPHPARRPGPALRAVHSASAASTTRTTRAASCTPSTTCCSITHNRLIRLEVSRARQRPAHPVAGLRSTRPTTGTSARRTTSSASSSTATPP